MRSSNLFPISRGVRTQLAAATKETNGTTILQHPHQKPTSKLYDSSTLLRVADGDEVLLEWMHVYRHDRIELYFEDLSPNVSQKKSNEPTSFVVENSSFRLIDCNKKHRRFFGPPW